MYDAPRSIACHAPLTLIRCADLSLTPLRGARGRFCPLRGAGAMLFLLPACGEKVPKADEGLLFPAYGCQP
ncbi:hypothetical protein D0Y53_04655 [Luteimonas weifangensis]|uniref:Uncharacterized protein n=1 Tax=Cognatiluteimonas weifangensis TaxID=2303539 RepID=A0A372DPW8_9GAMM|nr:hypothetical protein D0Y53_04655 [Luteimonas weifangensis]